MKRYSLVKDSSLIPTDIAYSIWRVAKEVGIHLLDMGLMPVT